MNVWWCNQSGQWDVERPEGVVCSHDSSRTGGNNTYRKSVGEAKEGDLVVHYCRPNVVAFSRALEDGSFHEQLPTLQGEDYEAGWRFRTEYHDLKTPVPAASFGERLIPLRFTHYAFDGNGHERQGYCFRFDLAGLKVVLSEVREVLPEWLEAHRAGPVLIPEEVSDPRTFIEGAVSTIAVNRCERDREARRLCIEHHGARCQACGIDLGERYGEVAAGLIHVHHKTPLSEIGDEYVVDPINDLCPVCPNCHAVIHLRTPPYSIEELKVFLGVR